VGDSVGAMVGLPEGDIIGENEGPPEPVRAATGSGTNMSATIACPKPLGAATVSGTGMSGTIAYPKPLPTDGLKVESS
jgi:hypothetical protein